MLIVAKALPLDDRYFLASDGWSWLFSASKLAVITEHVTVLAPNFAVDAGEPEVND